LAAPCDVEHFTRTPISARNPLCSVLKVDFVDALSRVAAGGTALDPEVVAQLLGASVRGPALGASLTPREGEVLALMAEGRSNAAIADRLVVGEGAVEKHVANIFLKLGLPSSDSDNRRVLAVLRYLEG
jgi:DNA-binding NarL/FixJ family response regulator